MGWGSMLLLGNVGQQLDIDDLNGSVAGMRRAFLENQQVDREQERSIGQLQRENQELKLYLATLIQLLVAKGVLQQDEIETVVKAIEVKT
jgi:hypothetical protein